MHALYGFARYADEIVDRTGDRVRRGGPTCCTTGRPASPPACTGAPIDDPLLPAVLHTIAVFHLDRADFALFLRSMAMDLTIRSYRTYDDLLDYMEGSAAVIGTMMLPILGSDDLAAAREPARQLGLRLPADQLHPRRRRGPGAGSGSTCRRRTSTGSG